MTPVERFWSKVNNRAIFRSRRLAVAFAASVALMGCLNVKTSEMPLPTVCAKIPLVASPDIPSRHLTELTKDLDLDRKLVVVLKADQASIIILETALEQQKSLIRQAGAAK